MGDDNSNKAIGLVVGLIVTFLLATVVLAIFLTARSSANKTIGKIQDVNNMLDESEYTAYENQIISGSQVQSLVSQWKGDEVCVKVITKTNTTCYNYTDSSLQTKSDADPGDATRKSNPNYINPSGQFLCTIGNDGRDENGVLVMVTFEQQ